MVAAIAAIIGIAFLALTAGLKIEHVRANHAKEEAAAAKLALANAKTKFDGDLKGLDEKYKGSQDALKKLREREATNAARAAKAKAAHDAADSAAADKIAALEASSKVPTVGDPNAKAIRVLRELARDLMRNDSP